MADGSTESAIEEEGLDRVLEDLDSAQINTRCAAVLKLSRVRRKDTLDRLLALVTDESVLLAYFVRAGLIQYRINGLAAGEPEDDHALVTLHGKLESPYIEERLLSAAKVSWFDSPASHVPLLQAFRAETEPRIQALLVPALLRSRDPEMQKLIRPLLDHDDPRLRAAAIEGFWGWGGDEVEARVRDLLKDPDPRVRAHALTYVVGRDDPRAQEQARKALEHQSQVVKIAALHGVAALEAQWARDLISAALRNNDEAILIRLFARVAMALGPALFGDVGDGARAAAADPTLRSDLTRNLPSIPDVDELKLALQQSDPLMRVHGLQNVERFDPKASLPILHRLVKWEKDDLVISTLVKALTRIGGTAEAEMVKGFLDHPDPRVRANALEALVPHAAAVDLVTICKEKLLRDHVARVRSLAAIQLFEVDAPGAIRHFREMILGNDAMVRESALLILTMLHDERILAVFRDALLDRRREIYSKALEIVEDLATKWPEAERMSEDFHAGKIAGEVIEGDPIEALMISVNSPQASDRIRALQKLWRSMDGRVDVVLELNLSSRDPEVKREALRALRKRNETTTLPRLFSELGHRYHDMSQQGFCLGPREVEARVRRASAELGATADAASIETPVAVAMGQALFQAHEEEIPLDECLRALCVEIRIARRQMEADAAGELTPEKKATRKKEAQRRLLDTLEAMPESGRRPPVEFDMTPPAPEGGGWGRRVFIFSLYAASLAAAFTLGGRRQGGVTTVTAASDPVSDMVLDLSGRITDRREFQDRFRGKAVVFDGDLTRFDPVSGDSEVRRGSVTYLVQPTAGSPPPAGGVPPGKYQVDGQLWSLRDDGSIEIKGTVTPLTPRAPAAGGASPRAP